MSVNPPTFELSPQPPGHARRFDALVKPIGAGCNVDCTYRYYLHKKEFLG